MRAVAAGDFQTGGDEFVIELQFWQKYTIVNIEHQFYAQMQKMGNGRMDQ